MSRSTKTVPTRTHIKNSVALAATLSVAVGVITQHAIGAGIAMSQGSRVAIVYGDRPSYREAATALERELVASGHDCILIAWPTDKEARTSAIDRLTGYEPSVVATGGAIATKAVLKKIPDLPVVFFMIPNALDASFLAPTSPNRHRVAGVPADVSPLQQIAWVSSLHANGRRLGILHSERSQKTVTALVEAAKKRGMAVSPVAARRDDFAAAIDALNDKSCDSVLMVADAGVYNSVSVQRLLLWGIRKKKPVFAFSNNVVKAGAAAGWSCDRGAVGHQAATLVQRVLDGESIAQIGIHYVTDVRQAANRRTTDIIGHSLDVTKLDSNTLWFGVE